MKTDRIYRERDITIDKVADRLGTNRSYLSRAINENGGMSFSQYINSRRIGEARRILSETDNDIQIKVLAYELGFATPETFSSTCRKDSTPRNINLRFNGRIRLYFPEPSSNFVDMFREHPF